jgi:hypothetical protein
MNQNKNKLALFLIWLFVIAAVVYPLWAVISVTDWSNNDFKTFLQNIFPLLGILAASLLWVHSISGVFENWIRKHINFDAFISTTATIILISMLLHPILLLISFGFNLSQIFTSFGHLDDIFIGLCALILLLSYDVGKYLKKHGSNFFANNWNWILIISNVGFLLVFIHSLAIGGDLQSGAVRVVWKSYGITALLAIVYTYLLRPVFSKN